MTTAWPSWIQFEQYSAIHDLPFATKANGFEGLDAELHGQQPGSRQALAAADGHGEGGHVQIRRPRQRAGPAVLSGQAAISSTPPACAAIW